MVAGLELKNSSSLFHPLTAGTIEITDSEEIGVVESA
jgi:hypothetical protein